MGLFDKASRQDFNSNDLAHKGWVMQRLWNLKTELGLIDSDSNTSTSTTSGDHTSVIYNPYDHALVVVENGKTEKLSLNTGKLELTANGVKYTNESGVETPIDLTALITSLNTAVNQTLSFNSPMLSISNGNNVDLSSLAASEVNDLTAAVTWANVPNANITEGSVTQHQSALSITESQISDLQSYLTAEVNNLSLAVTWANVPDANITQSSVTQHQAALSVTASQVSDFASNLAGTTNTDVFTPTLDYHVATKKYVDDNASSVSFGTDQQIPFMNLAGTDYDYDANFLYDDAAQRLYIGTNSGSPDIVLNKNGILDSYLHFWNVGVPRGKIGLNSDEILTIDGDLKIEMIVDGTNALTITNNGTTNNVELFGKTGLFGATTAGEGVLRFNPVTTAPAGTMTNGVLMWNTGTALNVMDSAGTITNLLAGGGVSVSGTPVNDQLAVWVNASTIEGNADLTLNGSNLQIGGIADGTVTINKTETGIASLDFNNAGTDDAYIRLIGNENLSLNIGSSKTYDFAVDSISKFQINTNGPKLGTVSQSYQFSDTNQNISGAASGVTVAIPTGDYFRTTVNTNDRLIVNDEGIQVQNSNGYALIRNVTPNALNPSFTWIVDTNTGLSHSSANDNKFHLISNSGVVATVWQQGIELFGNGATSAIFGVTTNGDGVLKFNDVTTEPEGTLTDGGGIFYVTGEEPFYYSDVGNKVGLIREQYIAEIPGTLSTGASQYVFRMPYAAELVGVKASVSTAPTVNPILVDINETGTTIFSTRLSIDATEKTSTTAAAPPVISDSSLADDAEITIDIDQVGTVAGADLKIYFTFMRKA